MDEVRPSGPDFSSLAALLAAIERRAAEAEQMQASAPVAAVLRSILAELNTLDGARAPKHEPGAPAVERLLTASEAAKVLGVAPKWLYRRADTLPFTRRLSSHVVRFDAAGLARWVGRRA